MFKPMRRIRQQLSKEECQKILQNQTVGTLALAAEGEYPYAVPLNYVYYNERIYFHCAVSGHKLDIIAKQNKVSFCIIDKDTIVPEKYTTYFRSVIVFGRIEKVENDEEKMAALKELAYKYVSQNNDEAHLKEINGAWNRTCVLALTVDHLTGKEAIELIAQK